MRSNYVRVIPEFRENVDIEKLGQALIEIAKSIDAKKQAEQENSPPADT